MYHTVAISPNWIKRVHDTRVCSSIPVYTGRLPVDEAKLHVQKIADRFRDYDVSFYETTDYTFKQNLLVLFPYVVRIQCSGHIIRRYYDALILSYNWCVANCQSPFIINENGFGFLSEVDCMIFKVTFGTTLVVDD